MTRKDDMQSHGAASLFLLELTALLTLAGLTIIGSVQLASRVHHLFHPMPAQNCSIQDDPETEFVCSDRYPPFQHHLVLETITHFRSIPGLENAALGAQRGI